MKRIFFGLLLGLLAAELLLHFLPLTGSGNIQIVRIPETVDGRTVRFYQPAPPPLGWTHNPQHPACNPLTLIGPQLPAEKQSSEIRLLVLGDSVTELGGPEGYGFPSVLGDILDGGPGRVHVLNAGTGGYNTAQELAWFKLYGKRCQPDAVILAFVNNDLAPAGERVVLPDGVEFHYRQPDAVPLLLDFGPANRHIFSTLQTVALTFRILTPWLEGNGWVPPRPRFDPNREATQESLRLLRDLCRQQELPLLVVHIPTWPAAPFRHLHDTIRAFCHNLDIPYLDASPVLQNPDQYLEDETTDGLAWHLSRQGHRSLAEALASRVLTMGWVTAPPGRVAPGLEAIGPPPDAGIREIRTGSWQGRTLEILIDPTRDLAPEGWLRGGELKDTSSITFAWGTVILAPGRLDFWRSGRLKTIRVRSLYGIISAPFLQQSMLDLTPDGDILSWQSDRGNGVFLNGKPHWLAPWAGNLPGGVSVEDLLGRLPDTTETLLAAWLDRIELPDGPLQFNEPALTWLRVAGNTITAVQRPYASIGHMGTREVDVADWWGPGGKDGSPKSEFRSPK